MSYSATFLLKVSERVSLKTTTKDYFEGKKCYTFWRYSSILKKEECDQRALNISDQYEALTPSSFIYFLGMRVQLLQKLATQK